MSEANETLPVPPPGEPGADQAAELARVLEGYMAELDAGRSPDRAKLLAEYPALASELEKCLSGIEFIHRTAGSTGEAPVLLGDFQIVREVGRGGMGVVYEARQVSLDRKVALKVLRVGGPADREALERFRREAATVAQLHHTNIVPIFAIGSEGGVSYYAMQFIEGRSLAAILEEGARSGERIDPVEVARWGLQAAEALDHAHRRGVIHRDVKPGNLLLDPEGRIWLTDFGLAKRAEDATLSLTGALLGTPRYMSPEQASATRMPVDERTDIYSLGATLYELATGRAAFVGETAHQVISLILSEEPAAPRRVRPGLPRDLETIIQKCMAKEAGRRYGSAGALADDLRALPEGRAIRARRAGLAERAARWTRKQRRSLLVAGTAAAAAAVLIAGSILGLSLYREARLGRIVLSTSGSSLVAEVLDPGGVPVVPGFPVGSGEPVALPEGSYSLRISAAGQLSETWPIEVERGVERRYPVSLRGRWLWPPIPIDSEVYETQSVIDLGSRTVIILVRFRPNVSVRCLDGSTGKPAWSADAVFDPGPAPPRNDPEWTGLLLSQGVLGDVALVRPAPDLDGDGTGDLVWACRTSPSLLALSGKDGRLLWWFRAGPRAGETAEPAGRRLVQAGKGAVLGQPAAFDADGDGTPDLIAPFVSEGDSLVDEAGRGIPPVPRGWVEAVSGRTGTSLWRHPIPLDPRWLEGRYSFHSRFDEDDPRESCRLLPGRLGPRPAIAVLSGPAILTLDPGTGEEARPPVALGFRPLVPPSTGDFDGDGTMDLLFLRRQPSGESWEKELALTLISLGTGRPIWEKVFRPTPQEEPIALRGSRDGGAVHFADDLDGDGRPEAILAVGQHGLNWSREDKNRSQKGWEPGPGESWTGLEVADGATGASRWTRRLARLLDERPPAIDHFLPGPDLDGDGTREILAAWLGPYQSGGVLVIQALSGRDGSTLWETRLPRHPGPGGTLRLWGPGADGWPLLLVPLSTGASGPPVTVAVSSGTGRVAGTLSGIADPQFADLDGDGLPDLHFTLLEGGVLRLHALRGEVPEGPMLLGRWLPTGDLDGDGHGDLVGWEPELRRPPLDTFSARSGRDGHRLWRTAGDAALHGLRRPLPAADLDLDGIPDLVNLYDLNDGGGWRVSAFSGKDGRRLWTTSQREKGFGTSEGHGGTPWGEVSHPWLSACDLDGDGRAEVLVGFPEERHWLAVLSGADGKTLWKTQVDQVIGRKDATGQGAPADLSGDGLPDIVVWTPGRDELGNARRELRAFRGTDGAPLWASAPVVSGSHSGGYAPPPFAVGDLDGDRIAEVVVAVHRADESGKGSLFEAVAIRGGDGARLWTWSRRSGRDLALPPLLADLDGDGRREVCLGILDQQAPEIVILDSQGRLRSRLPWNGAEATSHWPEASLAWWRAGDVDGDGREEILFLQDGALVASRGSEGAVLWKWPLSGGRGEIFALRSAKGRPGTVVLWSGRTVLGLDGATGRPGWRCEVPNGLWQGMSSNPSLALLAAGDPMAPPRIWHYASEEFTVCRQALPVGPDGRYRPLAPSPLAFAPVQETPILVTGPSPWARAVPAIAGAILAFPLVLALRALRSRAPARLRRTTLCLPLAGAGYIAWTLAAVPFPALVKIPFVLLEALTILSASFFAVLAGRLAARKWRGASILLAATVLAAPAVAWLSRDVPTSVREAWLLRGWPGWWIHGLYLTGGVVLIGLAGRSALRIAHGVIRRAAAWERAAAERQGVPGLLLRLLRLRWFAFCGASLASIGLAVPAVLGIRQAIGIAESIAFAFNPAGPTSLTASVPVLFGAVRIEATAHPYLLAIADALLCGGLAGGAVGCLLGACWLRLRRRRRTEIEKAGGS